MIEEHQSRLVAIKDSMHASFTVPAAAAAAAVGGGGLGMPHAITAAAASLSTSPPSAVLLPAPQLRQQF